MVLDDKIVTVIAGCVSGAAADVITHPISTVKTRLQVCKRDVSCAATDCDHVAAIADDNLD